MLSASSARTTSASWASPPASRTAAPLGEPATGSPKRASTSLRAAEVVRVLRDRLDARAADLGLERLGRALGDDAAAVDDPDAVREHVGLLEVLGREEDGHAAVGREPLHLLPERAPALHVEAGGGLVEEQDARPVDERQREVEPPLHAARVAAHAAVGGLHEPDALEQLLRALARLRRRGMPCRAVWSRRCSRPVRNGSSAASWSAAPIVARTAGPSSTTSCPATHARPAVGGSSVVSMWTVVDLPGAVRPEEAVDLAGLDAQVDAVDRARALLELPDEALRLDGGVGHAPHTTQGAPQSRSTDRRGRPSASRPWRARARPGDASGSRPRARRPRGAP